MSTHTVDCMCQLGTCGKYILKRYEDLRYMYIQEIMLYFTEQEVLV